MDNRSVLLFLVATLIPGGVICYLAGFIVRRVAPGWGLIDQPGERKVHTTSTPMGGGLAIWLGVMLSFGAGQAMLWLAASSPRISEALPNIVLTNIEGLKEKLPQLWILLAAGTVMMLLGLADDRFRIGWKIRLAVQAIVASAIVFGLGLRLTAFLDMPIVTGLLSVLWIMAMVNAFNMLDNMDGLSAGVAAIAASFLAAVMLIAPGETTGPQLFVAGLLLVLVGSLLGFLVHNRPPARLFMGDAGSYFIGFLIGIATILATYTSAPDHRHAILAPLCVMAVPLYDMITVILIRLRQGRSPFDADTNHFSHRLVALGLTKRKAVLTVYLTTATCGMGALLLHQVNTWGACVILLSVVSILALVAILESTARGPQKKSLAKAQSSQRKSRRH